MREVIIGYNVRSLSLHLSKLGEVSECICGPYLHKDEAIVTALEFQDNPSYDVSIEEVELNPEEVENGQVLFRYRP